MTEGHSDDDLKRLWRSATLSPTEDLYERALKLRRAGMRKAASEIILAAAVLAALAWELAGSSGIDEVLPLCLLGIGAAGSQIWLFNLRRRLWRDVGLSPCSYWASAYAKAKLGLRIARLTYIGGPPAIVGGALLAHALEAAATASFRRLGILAGACVLLLILGLRDARRERTELAEAQANLRELDC